MSAHQQLRSATQPDHEAVDAAYARFDLAHSESYAAFLRAHARVVPPLEARLGGVAGPPPLRPRTPLLVADLAAMKCWMPPALEIEPPASSAEAWGMAYVLEGSRLGGGVLARDVGDLPHSYLSDTHLSGEWLSFTKALDAALSGEDDIAVALRAARHVFLAYGRAAEMR